MRSYRSGLTGTKFIAELNKGITSYTWKGVPCLKMPIDLSLYALILWEKKSATIIELGTRAGGSALWFADMARIMGLETHIYSFDIAPPPSWSHPDITWGHADSGALADSNLDAIISNLPRPFLIIDDSSHFYKDVYAILQYFCKHMATGETLIIEDGIASDIVEDHGLKRAEEFMSTNEALEAIKNADHGGGPSPALQQFHIDYPDEFEVLEEYCDFFGKNVTGNPNGYLRKT